MKETLFFLYVKQKPGYVDIVMLKVRRECGFKSQKKEVAFVSEFQVLNKEANFAWEKEACLTKPRDCCNLLKNCCVQLNSFNEIIS